MNCSRCKTGVLESIGYLEMKQGPLVLNISFRVPEDKEAIVISICSNDHCGHTEMTAVPESLNQIKRKLRDSMYSEENIKYAY